MLCVRCSGHLLQCAIKAPKRAQGAPRRCRGSTRQALLFSGVGWDPQTARHPTGGGCADRWGNLWRLRRSDLDVGWGPQAWHLPLWKRPARARRTFSGRSERQSADMEDPHEIQIDETFFIGAMAWTPAVREALILFTAAQLNSTVIDPETAVAILSIVWPPSWTTGCPTGMLPGPWNGQSWSRSCKREAWRSFCTKKLPHAIGSLQIPSPEPCCWAAKASDCGRPLWLDCFCWIICCPVLSTSG